jgi:hypothetical protein
MAGIAQVDLVGLQQVICCAGVGAVAAGTAVGRAVEAAVRSAVGGGDSDCHQQPDPGQAEGYQ